jgi:hypothetical protein
MNLTEDLRALRDAPLVGGGGSFLIAPHEWSSSSSHVR